MSAALPRWRRVLLRERRLLLLCAGSALLHALALGLIARPKLLRQQAAAAPALTVKLAPATVAPAADPAQPAGVPVAVPLPARAALHGQPPAAAAESPPTAMHTGAAWDPAGAGADDGAAHLPGMQAVPAPPSARLAYAVSVQTRPDQPPGSAGAAALDWQLGEHGYLLQLSGASVLGEMQSAGQMADNGFAPLEARDGGGVVRFDWTAATARFERGPLLPAATLNVSADAQDRASMLMRLTGIGLGGANQFAHGVNLQVAGAGGVATVVFEQVGDGEETLPTPLGTLAALHLRQQVAAGQDQLEVWLAPQRGWLPVQLRLSRADGSVLTQTVTAISR